MFSKIKDYLRSGITNLKNFYTNNKKKIYLSLFLLSLHPHYKKYTCENDENSNKIPNFLTFEEFNERKDCLTNIRYKILFDFSNSDYENDYFFINGSAIIIFDFDHEKFPQNKKFLKLDYQGETISVYLDSQKLNYKKEYYTIKKETQDNYVNQEKNCIYIDKTILKEKNNRLIIEFSSHFSEEFRNKEINNPFWHLEQNKEENKNKVFKVISLYFL